MQWMRNAVPFDGAAVVVYRGLFTMDGSEKIEIEYSADERCQLFLDGALIADGPERGVPERWHFQRLNLTTSAGMHCLCARVWQLDKKYSPCGQLSVQQGFAIYGLTAQWSCKVETMGFDCAFPNWGTFPVIRLDENYPSGILAGKGDGWQPVEMFEDTRPLVPPELPTMLREPVSPVEIRPGVWRFDNYVCAYAVYHFKGIGTARIRWSEAPYDDDYFDRIWLKGHKGNRDGKFFYGKWDEFKVSGQLDWPTPWWHAGRYVEIECPDTLQVKIDYFRTGYPLPAYQSENPLKTAAYETLRNCCFETFMDCPYYEQMQYIGDSRLEALCIYMLGDDHRLIVKALRQFACGANPDGSLRSHYPSRNFQKIPSFTMIWMLMLQDYWKRHGRDAIVEELRQTANRLLRYWEDNTRDGLFIPDDESWNFVDWHSTWENGVPDGIGPCSILNFFYAMALRAYAEIFDAPGQAAKAEQLLERIDTVFLEHDTGLYRSFPECRDYCEHAQILAMLCGRGDRNKLADGLRSRSMTPCSIYFSYYFLDACVKCGLEDLKEARLEKYRRLLRQNLKTLPEEFDVPRSDCHAWSAHVMLLE